MIYLLGEKIQLKVYVNEHDFLSDIQTNAFMVIIAFVFSSCPTKCNTGLV
jgi:hypothetical protein